MNESNNQMQHLMYKKSHLLKSTLILMFQNSFALQIVAQHTKYVQRYFDSKMCVVSRWMAVYVSKWGNAHSPSLRLTLIWLAALTLALRIHPTANLKRCQYSINVPQINTTGCLYNANVCGKEAYLTWCKDKYKTYTLLQTLVHASCSGKSLSFN